MGEADVANGEGQPEDDRTSGTSARHRTGERQAAVNRETESPS
jgi:hypothetical protein